MFPRTRSTRDQKKESGPRPPHRERDNFTDVFYADQRQSFVSNISRNDISVLEEEEQYSNFKLVPLMYGIASIASISVGFADLYLNSEMTVFPHFFEIVIKKTNFFQIGISMSCLFGMATYYFMEIGKRNLFIPHRNRTFFECFIGILAQFFLLSFALIPTFTDNINKIRYEDTITLNGYFLFSFIYNFWYIRDLANSLTIQQKASYVYQIKLAFFVLISFIFVIYLFVFSVGFFQKGEYILPEIKDEIQDLIWNIFSMIAFVLYILNIVYLALFYHDLKKMSFQVIPNQFDRSFTKMYSGSNGNPIKIF